MVRPAGSEKTMEKMIEMGAESADSHVAIFGRIMEKFNSHTTIFDRIMERLDELLTIRLGKVKSDDYNTTTSPVLHRQDSAKAATPLPPLPTPLLPKKNLLPKPPVTASTLLPPPLLPVALTTLPPVSMMTQALPPILETTQELLLSVTVETPPSLVNAVVLVASAPLDVIVAGSLPKTAFLPPRVCSSSSTGTCSSKG